jgi:multidrug transporter EmrE-like cation transporter
VKTSVAAMAWVLLAGFFGSFGAAFLKAGAGKLGGDLKSILTNWRLAAGIGAYLVSSVFFVKGVNEGELSVLYPLVAVGYGWTMVWSKLFFHESLTPAKFTGVGLVLAGLTLLGYGASLR